MNNFLITAMGRSGTKYLQIMMNYSRIWRVKHEPDRDSLPPDHLLEEIQERFDGAVVYHKHYGEVNSTLRYMAMQLKVDKKGILIRDPAEVWISIANRKASQTWPYALAEYERAVEELDELRKAGASIIDFKRMITDKEYLIEILYMFGIDDVHIKNRAFKTPLNVTEIRTYNNIDEFNLETRNRVRKLQEIAFSWL